ncbi:MAG: CRISPR-associated endonuclease Cas6 [Bacteroidota bacterium]
MHLPLTTLTFPDFRLPRREASNLRGYFAETFGQDSVLFHNHTPEGYRYNYSEIQYKVIDGIATVVGIGPGSKLLLQVFGDVDKLVLGEQTLVVNTKELAMDQVELSIDDELYTYEFLTPWFALNQENYAQYRETKDSERPGFLDKILRSQLIALLEGLGYPDTKEKTILAKGQWRPTNAYFRGQQMQMFWGEFTTNVKVPSLLGIGKSTSRGFGTVIVC